MRLFIIFIAFVVSVGVGLAIWTLTGQEQGDQSTTIVQQPTPTEVAVQEATIFVARRDVPVGRQLTEEDIDRQPWPQHLVLEDFVKEGSEVQLIDMVARTPFKAREPFTFSRLGNPNDPGFLAAQLPKGKRAVTIAIDDISGVNGLVYPGDRVDVLIRHTVGLEQDYKSQEDITPSEDGIPQLPENAQTLAVVGQHQVPVLMNQGKRDAQPVIDLTEVLISNARVLAVGKDSYQYEGAEGNPTNVTLEVTNLQAQKLRHADAGALSLALRSLEDSEGDEVAARPIGNADMSKITPPGYFPYLYDQESEYGTEVLTLDEAGYDAAPEKEKEEEDGSSIVIIRGVEKETVGVKRP